MDQDCYLVGHHKKLEQYLINGHLCCIFGFGHKDMIPFETTRVNAIFPKLSYKDSTLFFLYKNIFYKNIKAEIFEMLRIF